MIKTVSRVMFAAAAASMAFAPIAAQAGTRAGDSGAVYSASSSVPGMGREDNGESLKSGLSIVLALIASGLIITGIVFASQSDDDGQSPGT
jgi:hypothetical protein